MRDYSRSYSRYPEDQLEGYIRDFLKLERMTLCHPTVLPIKAVSTLLIKQADDYKQANLTTYQRLTSKLVYLSYGTNPEIVFVVGQLSRHNLNQ